ncbi:cell division topological specificity factor MinE [Paracoccus sp. P2]|uniref:Cell division topological specificity factor n=1 Tax=Paracoccus pantotrophus TaxID=82367 RepID=A0A1I5LBA4_PARPN|nr:cell division topological specificity factor MinE [Paracoccus pantotrophus]MDF3856034.1 cell division topological specificity factor MinE [Paracoccus pantotrophus]QFG36275.1 cell division topological specificity factor MinE [Paracoccus pantotrophus]QLH16596.1 cell division topological specificity factor MinE [Paracoccus pantotrophus]RDD96118.1 cell division topological specificity factor MinE [Paracoccus pantotrophus]RKS43147.1 cell division topological specificity factor MinE [Paracoccus p
MFGFSFRQRKPSSAQTAKERLQILLAHERSSGTTSPDFLPLLQRDILEVVRRHMEIDGDAVDIKLERSDDLSSLEINIELPNASPAKARPAS